MDLYFFTNYIAFSSRTLKFNITKTYLHFDLSFFKVAASNTLANLEVSACKSYNNFLNGILIYFAITFSSKIFCFIFVITNVTSLSKY